MNSQEWERMTKDRDISEDEQTKCCGPQAAREQVGRDQFSC